MSDGLDIIKQHLREKYHFFNQELVDEMTVFVAEEMRNAIIKGNKLEIRGFGSFRLKVSVKNKGIYIKFKPFFTINEN
jgi:nucleoid DNA-binding protein